MQPNNFRGFSSNNRYNNQNQQIFNQFNYQRNQNQNNLFFSNSNFGNSLQNSNNFPVRINPLSSFQMGSSSSPVRPTLQKKKTLCEINSGRKGIFFKFISTC